MEVIDRDSFYFVGIGGASMSALAKILFDMGKSVCGYDRARGEYTPSLEAMGISVDYGNESALSDGCSAVVRTDAVGEGERHVAEARAKGIPVVGRAELLASLAGKFTKTVAVAGCHGKTTCTAMLAHIFACAGKRFTAHIGGNDLTFSNAAFFGYDWFITEACEYKRNFLRLSPDVAVILNRAPDHLECYGGAEALSAAYDKFADGARKCVELCGRGAGRSTVTFGTDCSADYCARELKGERGRYSFAIFERGAGLCSVSLRVPGRHNVLNALAAAAAGRACGLRPEAGASGLEEFSGVARRFERLGLYNGAAVIADYAHHPDEIAAALRTAEETGARRLFVIFQPHTYSRTKNLFEDFVRVLSPVQRLLVYKTFAAREYFDADGSALTLCNAIKNARYADGVRDIERFLNNAAEGDVVLVLGAGDIYTIVRGMLR